MKRQGAVINYLYSAAYQIVAILIPLITTPYLTRRVGAVGLGEYAYAYSVAYYFTLFIKLGLNNYGNRTVATVRDDRAKLSRTFWSIYAFQFLLSVLFIAIYIVYSHFIADDGFFSILLIFFVISAGVDITWFFWGMELFRITVIRDFIVKILSTVLIFVFVKTSNDTWKYTLILSLGYFLSQILLWPSLKKYVDFVKPTFRECAVHLKPNLILFIPTVAVSLYKVMDKIMLKVLASSMEAGLYDSSEKVIQVPLALITSLGTVMLPKMSHMIAKGDAKAEEGIIRRSISFAMFMATSMSFGIMGIANIFVPLFYGKGYEKCVSLFYILLPSCLFLAFANVIRTQFLIPRKYDGIFIASLLCGAFTNITLNAIFIPSYGSVGAAIGTLAAEAVVCIFQVMAVRKKLPIGSFILDSVPLLLAGASIYFLCGWLNVGIKNPYILLGVKVVAGAIAYAVMAVITSFIHKKIKKDSFTFLDLLRSVFEIFPARRNEV